MCAWRGQDNLHESILSFCLMDPGDQTQIVRLAANVFTC